MGAAFQIEQIDKRLRTLRATPPSSPSYLVVVTPRGFPFAFDPNSRRPSRHAETLDCRAGVKIHAPRPCNSYAIISSTDAAGGETKKTTPGRHPHAVRSGRPIRKKPDPGRSPTPPHPMVDPSPPPPHTHPQGKTFLSSRRLPAC